MKGSLALALLLLTAQASAETITVSADGGGDYIYIASGVQAAQDGDTVLVSPGLYTGPNNRNIDFQGKRLVVRGAEGEFLPLIDCENEGRAFHLHSGEPWGTRIERLAIANGNALELDGASGGGVKVVDSRCEMRELKISNCIAGSGGGIRFHNGRGILDDVEIFACTAYINGGDFDVSGTSAATLRNTSIIGCDAT